VLGLSLLTNMGCGLEPGSLSHAHTLEMASASAAGTADYLADLVAHLEV
jgi:purine nucleoside phosphorylase